MCFIGISNASEIKGSSNTEYLDAARFALKTAYEAGAHLKAPYEYGKAKGFYNIAVEESSNFNVEESKEAAKKAIEWSLKAIEKVSKGEVK